MSDERAVEVAPAEDVASRDGPARRVGAREAAAFALQRQAGNRAAGRALTPDGSPTRRTQPRTATPERSSSENVRWRGEPVQRFIDLSGWLDTASEDERDEDADGADDETTTTTDNTPTAAEDPIADAADDVDRAIHDTTTDVEQATDETTTHTTTAAEDPIADAADDVDRAIHDTTTDVEQATTDTTTDAADDVDRAIHDTTTDVEQAADRATDDVDRAIHDTTTAADDAVGGADSDGEAITTSPRDAVAVLANPPAPPPPLSDLPPDPAVAEYRGQAQDAATSIDEPDTAAVTGPATDASAAAGDVDAQRRTERPDFDEEAEAALPPQPEPEDPRDAIPADPVPEANELMARHSTVRLDPQTLPDPVRSPNVDDEQYDVHVAGVLPGQPVAAPPPETAEAAAGERPSPTGTAGGADPAMQDAVEGADQPRAEDDRETEPAQPTVLTDDGPAPELEPAPAVPPEIMVDVVAAAVAAAGRTARGWARSAETRAFPNDVLHQVAPQIAETAVQRLTSDYVEELQGVAEAAGVAREALDTRVETFRAQIEASAAEASDELAAADEDTRAAIEDRVETDESAVTGAAEKNQDQIDLIREHAHLDPDEAAVVDKGLELIRGVREHALEIRGQRRAATDRRRQQLREARQRLTQQYEETSTAQARAIAGWYRRATPEPAEGQSSDDVARARDRAAVAAAGPTVRWASRQTAALGRQFTELGRELDRIVREQEAELDEAEQSALTMIRDWQQGELDERRTWFERLWHALTDWTTDATGATAEWEAATRERLAHDAQSDLATLGTILEGGIADVRARRDEIAAGLDDAQRAVLDAFLRPGGSIVSALSAGLVTRIMQRRVPELVDQFKAKAQELTELEPLVAIGRAQSSDFDAMGRAGRVHQAVDGMGTNEDRLFQALNGLTPIQVKAVQAAYAYLYPGSDMRADIQDDLDGVFDGDELGDRADALLSGNQMLADVAELRNAVEEWGTDEGAVYRLLRNRTPEERREIERLYQETYHESLGTRLDEEMDGLEQERAEALLAGDQQAADAIGLRDSLEGWSGGVFNGDAAGVEGVFAQIRTDVEERARAEGWTSEEVQAEIVRRNREVQAAYDAGTGLEAGMADGRSLSEAMANDIGTRDASVAFAMLRGDREGEDVARIRREVEAEFDTDDDVILEVLADQRRRARAETALDLNADLEARRVVEEWSAARTARERRDVRAEIERQATERTREQFESLSNRYDRESRHSLLPSGRLAHDLEDVMGGDDPQEAAAYIAQGGVLSEAQELYFAMQGAGTDDERVHRVLQDPANPGRLRSPEEMARIRREYAELDENTSGESLDDAIDGDFDGSDLRDVQYELMGQGTDAEMAARLAERNNREDEGLLWDGPGLAQLIMYDDYRARNRATGFAVRQARALEEMREEGDPEDDDELAIQTGEVDDQLAELRSQRATADEETQAIIDRQLQELTERRSHLADLARARGMFDTGMAGANELITINREQVDSITDDVANGVAAVAAMAVAIVLAPETGGGSVAAGAAAWAALMGSAAGTAAGLGTRMLIGREITPEMLGEQLAMGGVDAAVSLLTLGLGTGLARATLSDGVTLAGRGLADAISQSNRLMALVARSRMPAPIQRAILFEAGYIVETTVSTAVTTGAQMLDADVLRQPHLANVFWDRFGEGLVQGLTVDQARAVAMSHVENHLSERHRAAVRRRDERRSASRDSGSTGSTGPADTTSTDTAPARSSGQETTGDGVERVGTQLDSGVSDAQQHSNAEFDAATAAADALARGQGESPRPDRGGDRVAGDEPMFTEAEIDAAVDRLDDSAAGGPHVQIDPDVYTGDGSAEGAARIDVDGLESIRVDELPSAQSHGGDESALPAFHGDEVDAAIDAVRTDTDPAAAARSAPPIIPLSETTSVHIDQPEAPSGRMSLDQPAGVPVSPRDAEHSFGMPADVQQEFARFARSGASEVLGVERALRIDVRPTNVDSLAMLRSGEGAPKPEAIKAKTINDLDVRFLGARPDARGQVGFFDNLPATLGDRPPDVSPETWAAAQRRLEQRRQEHSAHAARMAQMELPLGHPGREGLPPYAADVRIRVEDGVVHQIGADGAVRPIVGDHDVFQITWEDGTPLTQQQHDAIVAEMRGRGMNVEHGMHMEWRPDAAGEEGYQGIVTTHSTGNEALLRINPDGSMETARAGGVPAVDDRGLMPGGTYVGDVGHQVPSPRRVLVVERRGGRVRDATWRQTVGGYDEPHPSGPWREPRPGEHPMLADQPPSGDPTAEAHTATPPDDRLPEQVRTGIVVPDEVRRRADTLHGDGGTPHDIDGPTEPGSSTDRRRELSADRSPGDGSQDASALDEFGRPDPNRPLTPVETAHDAFMERLRAEMNTPIEPATDGQPPIESGDVGTYDDPDTAYRAFRDAVARAGEREVGLFFQRETGRYAVRVGQRASVGYPDLPGRWECPIHTHPNPENVLTYRMPAPLDLREYVITAWETQRTIAAMVEFPYPDGTRGQSRLEVRPDRTLVFEFDGQATPERLTWDEYRARWDSRTRYVDPDSVQAARFHADIRTHLRDLERDRVLSADGGSTGDLPGDAGGPDRPERTSSGDIIDRGGRVESERTDRSFIRREFFAEDAVGLQPGQPHSPRYQAGARLSDDGTMSMDFGLRERMGDGEMHRSGSFRGFEEFQAALRHFRERLGPDAVRRIESLWGAGDNLEAFTQRYQELLGLGVAEESAKLIAASETPTGQWFQRAGFGRIASVTIDGDTITVISEPGASNVPPSPTGGGSAGGGSSSSGTTLTGRGPDDTQVDIHVPDFDDEPTRPDIQLPDFDDTPTRPDIRVPDGTRHEIHVPDEVRRRHAELQDEGTDHDAGPTLPATGGDDERATIPAPGPDESTRPEVRLPERASPEIQVHDDVRRRYAATQESSAPDPRRTRRHEDDATPLGPNAEGSESTPQQPSVVVEVHLPGVQEALRSTFESDTAGFPNDLPTADQFDIAESWFQYAETWRSHDPTNRGPSDLPQASGYLYRGTIYLPPGADRSTLAHESLHVVTNEAFKQAIPLWINEGVTEVLTETALGERSPNTGYGDNIEIAEMIRSMVGDDVLRRAYFQGEIGPLDAALEPFTGMPDTCADLRDFFKAFGIRGDTPMPPNLLDILRGKLGGPTGQGNP